MKRVLVTGGAGFIGSNFVRHMLESEHDYFIINVDALTYAGNLENLADVADDPNYVFVKADIRDRQAIDRVFREYEVEWVVNFAAESHVDRSIVEPDVFLTTNVIGTQVLLDTAKKYWKVNPDDKYCREYKPGVNLSRFQQTKYMAILAQQGSCRDNALVAEQPYSASKASADLVVRAYHRTLGCQ